MKILKVAVCLLFAVVMSACLPQFQNQIFYNDYSSFTSQGFFITESNSVGFDYTAIGSMELRQSGGVKKDSATPAKKENVGYDDIFGDKHPEKTSQPKEKFSFATAQSALDEFVSQARKKGANGVINLKITTPVNKAGENWVYVSGMLIKK